MEHKTIMIVDDERGIRETTGKLLKRLDYDVIMAKNGMDALEKLEVKFPDLILLDIEMPHMDGFAVCKEVRRMSNVPIIFLTVRRDTFDKIKCFQLGGDDYLTKPFAFEELEARIHANLRRYYTYPDASESILKFGELEIHLQSYHCYMHGELVNLSAKEMELLILLAKHPNQVWTHEQLYDHVWSEDATGNVNTVRVHIRYLRKKLSQYFPDDFIQTVHGFGYMFSP